MSAGRDIGTRDMLIGSILIGVYFFGVMTGHTVSTSQADQHEQTAIANAVSEALENNRPVMTCKEQKVIDGIKALAENGVHMTGFSLEIKVDNREVGE